MAATEYPVGLLRPAHLPALQIKRPAAERGNRLGLGQVGLADPQGQLGALAVADIHRVKHRADRLGQIVVQHAERQVRLESALLGVPQAQLDFVASVRFQRPDDLLMLKVALLRGVDHRQVMPQGLRFSHAEQRLGAMVPTGDDAGHVHGHNRVMRLLDDPRLLRHHRGALLHLLLQPMPVFGQGLLRGARLGDIAALTHHVSQATGFVLQHRVTPVEQPGAAVFEQQLAFAARRDVPWIGPVKKLFDHLATLRRDQRGPQGATLQLRRRVAGNLFGGAVDPHNVALAIEQHDHRGGGVDHRIEQRVFLAQALLTFLQGALCVVTPRHIGQRNHHVTLAVHFERADAQFHREQFAASAAAGQIAPAALFAKLHQPGVLQIGLTHAHVGLAQILRQQHLHRLADHLVAGVAEGFLDPRTDLADTPLGIGQDDRFGGGVENQLGTVLAVSEALLGGLETADIQQRADHSVRPLLLIEQHPATRQHAHPVALSMAQAHLAGKTRLLATHAAVDQVQSLVAIIRMNQALPGGKAVLQLLIGIAQQGLPARRVIHIAGLHIPIPHGIVGGPRHLQVAFVGSRQRTGLRPRKPGQRQGGQGKRTQAPAQLRLGAHQQLHLQPGPQAEQQPRRDDRGNRFPDFSVSTIQHAHSMNFPGPTLGSGSSIHRES